MENSIAKQISADPWKDEPEQVLVSGGDWLNIQKIFKLTAKESAAARMCCDGRPYKQIAANMNTCVGTVYTHLHFAFMKMGVRNRMHLYLRALEVKKRIEKLSKGID
jgi:DNA-binding NarL/FixJ family response regulator